MSASGLSPELERRFERFGLEFLVEFLGRAIRQRPQDLELLAERAGILTRLGRYEEGLAADEELVRRAPADPSVRYNLACSLALLGRQEEALDALERAHALGYADLEHLLADEDLHSLRPLARFQALVSRLRAAR